MRPAVFLDRDGTLNERPSLHQYVRSRSCFRWIAGAAPAIGRLCGAGYAPIVVSNQRGIARGLVSAQALEDIERRIRADLATHGGEVLAFYYCPHDLDAGCSCRKPAPGLIQRSAADHEIDLASSFMVGDAESDIEAGIAAGCATVRIGRLGVSSRADLVVPDLGAAAEAICATPRATIVGPYASTLAVSRPTDGDTG